MATYEELLFMQDLNTKYPFDKNQKAEIIMLGDGPEWARRYQYAIAFDGHAYEYNTKEELQTILNRREDIKYLRTGVPALYKEMFAYIKRGLELRKDAKRTIKWGKMLYGAEDTDYKRIMHEETYIEAKVQMDEAKECFMKASEINKKYFHLTNANI